MISACIGVPGDDPRFPRVLATLDGTKLVSEILVMASPPESGARQDIVVHGSATLRLVSPKGAAPPFERDWMFLEAGHPFVLDLGPDEALTASFWEHLPGYLELLGRGYDAIQLQPYRVPPDVTDPELLLGRSGVRDLARAGLPRDVLFRADAVMAAGPNVRPCLVVQRPFRGGDPLLIEAPLMDAPATVASAVPAPGDGTRPGRAPSTPDLTVVIVFLNERDELDRTVASIRETAGGQVNLLLINDASNDGYDYQAVAHRYDCRYVVNEERLGTSRARDLGVELAQTNHVLSVDAHVRPFTDEWSRRIRDALEDDPRAAYCVAVPPIDADGQRTDLPIGRGAHVELGDEDGKPTIPGGVLSPAWNITRRTPGPVEAVPCVLGGAYAFRRDFYRHLWGLRGHWLWGREEPYLSMKAWLAGGSCKLLDDVEIGHIYRTPAERPYEATWESELHNIMVLIGTVFPEAYFARFGPLLDPWAPASRRLLRAAPYVRALRDHLHRHVFVRPVEDFLALNDAFARGESIAAWLRD